MNTNAIGLIVLAVIFGILAILYGTGAEHWFTTPGRHYKHAIVFVILAILALVGASMARREQQA
jgi:membrane protein DedA with SNARE-associated domain